MIRDQETEGFIQELQALFAMSTTLTNGTDVVLLMGGTGNGKSTILNMLAGSRITATRNPQKRRNWKFSADPEIAMIGHTVSMTFLPNYWDHENMKIFDCPGFCDNRGLAHEIVKSLFIKQIADNARSIKIIMVAEISALGSRCGPFETYMQHLKDFIPGFNISKDYSLIITKATSYDEPIGVVQDLQADINLTIDESIITLIYLPERQGIYDYSYLNFQRIIDQTPTISSKCNIPLSAQAKVKLAETNTILSRFIKSGLKAYCYALKLFYLEVMTHHVQKSNIEVQRIFDLFNQAVISIKQSENEDELLRNIKRWSNKLSTQTKVQFNFTPYYEYLNKKIKNVRFLRSKFNYGESYFDDWLPHIRFDGQRFYKSNNEADLKNKDILTTFLRENIQIDINNPIQGQAHIYLNKSRTITSTYAGSQTVSGALSKTDKCTRKIKIPISTSIKFKGQASFSIYVPIYKSNVVSGSVSVVNCSCGNWLVKRCLNCNSKYRNVSYSKCVQYKDSIPLQGTVPYQGSEPINEIRQKTCQQTYNVYKPYSVSVPYTGSTTSSCQNHHECSCKLLAKIVISGKELVQDIKFYQQILINQVNQMTKMGNPVVQNSECALLTENDLNFQGYQISNNRLTLAQIENIIHEKLSKDHTYTAAYNGGQYTLIQRAYNQNIRLTGYYDYQKYVVHEGTISTHQLLTHYKTISYYGSVTCQTCYLNCSWCNSSYYQKSYSGETTFDIRELVPVTAQYKGQQTYRNRLYYDETATQCGTLSQNKYFTYNGNISVTCEKSNLVGSGHHDCTSCRTWSKFVQGIQKLLQAKNDFIRRIQENSSILTTLHANQLYIENNQNPETNQA